MNYDNHYWNGKAIHYCFGASTGDQEADCACGIKISTWKNPAHKTKNRGNEYGTESHPELDLGGSLDPYAVNCESCIDWLNNNRKVCDGGCGRLATYSTCPRCLRWCMCGEMLMDDDSKDRDKWEKHEKHCKKRQERLEWFARSGKVSIKTLRKNTKTECDVVVLSSVDGELVLRPMKDKLFGLVGKNVAVYGSVKYGVMAVKHYTILDE